MELIADMMLIAAALGTGLYCVTLSRRLTRFNSLENGVGGAIAVLSQQVDGMTKTLENARQTAETERETLDELTARAEEVAGKLELLVAAMHDLPVGAEATAPEPDVASEPPQHSEANLEPDPAQSTEAEPSTAESPSDGPEPTADPPPPAVSMFSSRRKGAST